MPTSDRAVRRHKRVTITIRAPLATDSGSGVLVENSSTIDISDAGLRLRLRGQIVPGDIVHVFLSNRPQRCRVVWTSPGAAATELIAGLEFIHPLPDPYRFKTPR